MGTISLRLGLGFVLILTALTVGVLHADEKATPDPVAELQRADQFFVAGNFVEAEESYRTLLAAHPTLISAQAGLVRSLLRHQNVDESSELINNLYDSDRTHTAPAQTSTPGPLPSFPKQGSTQ